MTRFLIKPKTVKESLSCHSIFGRVCVGHIEEYKLYGLTVHLNMHEHVGEQKLKISI